MDGSLHACCVLVFRFILAAQEVNYAAKVLKLVGDQMQNLRFWQYVIKNGKDTLFEAYSVSLDLYVLFCWSQLGGLSNLLTGLLVAEVRMFHHLSSANQALSCISCQCIQQQACRTQWGCPMLSLLVYHAAVCGCCLGCHGVPAGPCAAGLQAAHGVFQCVFGAAQCHTEDNGNCTLPRKSGINGRQQQLVYARHVV